MMPHARNRTLYADIFHSIQEGHTGVQGRYPPLAPELIEKCNKASNCEVHTTELGDILRFKPGMEPGTAIYNSTVGREEEELLKHSNSSLDATALHRRATWTTDFNSGTWRMEFGALNPYDAFVKIWDACQETYCYTGNYKVRTSFLWGERWSDVDLDVRASGQYPSWAHRNNFARLIMEACQKNQQWRQERFCVGPRAICTEQKWVANAPNFYNINRWTSTNEFGGWLNIVVENNNSGGRNDCWDVVSQLGAVVGAANGWAGYFFGQLNAACK
jgi:hypothetical protein